MVFYKEDPFNPDLDHEIQPRAFINFSEVKDIGAKKDVKFRVETPERIWRFRCKSQADRDSWVRDIKRLVHEAKRNSTSKWDHTPADGLSQVELDEIF